MKILFTISIFLFFLDFFMLQFYHFHFVPFLLAQIFIKISLNARWRISDAFKPFKINESLINAMRSTPNLMRISDLVEISHINLNKLILYFFVKNYSLFKSEK
jgi:hypothetical protein